MRPYRTPYGEIRNEIAETARRRAAEAGWVDKRSDQERDCDGVMLWIALAAILVTAVWAGLHAWPFA